MNSNHLIILPRELARFRSRFIIGESSITGRAILDDSYYLWRYPDVSEVEPFRHFLVRGQVELRNPNCLFEVNYYIERHREECRVDSSDLDQTPVGHFIGCEFFTCPSPLLTLESGEDRSANRRALYLSLVTQEKNADAYATPYFDVKRYGVVNAESLPFPTANSAESGMRTISSLMHYATLSSKRDSIDRARNPSDYFDNLHINHVATQGGMVSLATSPLAWYLMSQKNISTTHQIPSPVPALPISAICRSLTSRSQAAELEKSVMRILNHPAGEVIEPTADGTSETKCISVLSIHLNSPKYNALSLGLLSTDYEARKSLEIVMIDNASDDHKFQEVHEHLAPHIERWIRTETRLSFAEANNVMSEVSRSKYLLFLNSDAFVLPTTVLTMAKHLDDNPETVAVAPTLYYPDGRVQETGGLWVSDGSVVQLGKGASRFTEIGEIKTDSPDIGTYRSAACLMVRASTFELVGGFSPHYDPAYFEDTDLCAKLSRHGAIDSLRDARCIHLEGATNNEVGLIENRRALIEANRATFSRRIPRIMSEKYIATKPYKVSSPHSLSAPSFLVTSPFQLNVGGGEKYILEVARLLSGFGSVAIGFPAKYSQLRLAAICDELGIERFSAQLITISQARNLRPQVHIAMGNSAFPPIEGLGHTSIYHCQFPFRQLDPPTDDEISRLSGYGIAVVNSKFTQKHLEQCNHYWKGRTVVIAPPVTVDSETRAFSVAPDVRNSKGLKILSVGRFFNHGHRKNQHLLVAAFGKLLDTIPDASLTLIGGVSGDSSSLDYVSSVRELASGLPVEIITNPSRTDILEEISSSSVYWHATGLDVAPQNPEGMEHFGISVIEACQGGLFPFAHDSGGPAEVLGDISPFSLYSTLDDLIERTVHFVRSESRRNVQAKLRLWSQKFNRAEFDQKWNLMLGLTDSGKTNSALDVKG